MKAHIEKLKRSALLTISGMAVTVIPVITNETIDFVQTGDPIDYRTSLVLIIGASSSFFLNVAKKSYDYLTSSNEAKD